MSKLALIIGLVVAGCGGASPPPAAPTSGEAIAAVQHNLDVVNAYRAEAGVAPLVLDETLSEYARAANAAFAGGGGPHAYLREHTAEIRAAMGARVVFENQGKRGGSRSGVDPATLTLTHIDAILAGMMAEGPGGGHHDTILNPELHRIGIGIVVDGKRVILTNDFTD